MRLAAEESLVLCRMRLQDLIGILSIREMPILVASGGERRGAA